MLLFIGLLGAAPAGLADEADDGADEPKCIILIDPQPGWDIVLFSVDLELSEKEMAELEDEVDTDDDGAITAAEVAAYEADSDYIRDDYWSMGEKKLSLDSREPEYVLFRTQLNNFEGVVGGERKRVVTEHREHHFDLVSVGSYHTIDGGNNSSTYNVVIELVIIRAPDGWRITSTNGTEQNATTLEMRGFDIKNRYSITFQATDAAPTPLPEPTTKGVYKVPGPAALLALAAATIGLVIARTRRP